MSTIALFFTYSILCQCAVLKLELSSDADMSIKRVISGVTKTEVNIKTLSAVDLHSGVYTNKTTIKHFLHKVDMFHFSLRYTASIRVCNNLVSNLRRFRDIITFSVGLHDCL